MTVFELLASSPGWWVATCLILGLLVGSFLNVVIYRLPVMLDRQWRQQCAELTGSHESPNPPSASQDRFNLIEPRSACPQCKTPIRAFQNVPLVSYLFL